MHVYISSIGAIVQLGARLHECTYLQFTYTLVETSFSFNFILYGFIDPPAALKWRCTLSSLRILTVGCVVLANQATVECTHP